MTDDPLLHSLTEAQREAVLHVEGPMLVLAGPGSGKTRVVTHRIANLLRRGVPARRILALTFTNKAANEMKSRVEHLAPGEAVWMSTFHRFCARLLRQYAGLVGLEENFAIYDTDDSGKLLKQALDDCRIDAVHYTPARIASAISWAKNNLILPEQYAPQPGQPLGTLVQQIYPAYQTRLTRSNAVDFDDLLMHVGTLLRNNEEIRQTLDARFQYVLVDEYQDTNLAQYAIVRALCNDHPNLAVTGDPDQSIYGWRGANIKNILDFEVDYPEVRVVRLEQNYRSTKSILRVADALIGCNRQRKAKELFTDNGEGRPVRLVTYPTQRDEAEGIASHIAHEVRSRRRRPRDFAVFYRTNALTRSLEIALREQGVPYQLVHAVEFYQRKEIKDVLAYLALINNPRDNLAFLRVINTPARGIGKKTLERLSIHADESRLSLLDAARESAIVPGVATRTAVEVAKFVTLYDRLSLLAAKPVEEILGHVLSETGYEELLEASDDPADQDRLANIQELLTAARQFDERNPVDGMLEEFLEGVCLVSDTDAFEAETDRVTLMTLHASKGLEFPAVFIIGVEQGLLPHERSRESAAQLEEERRLFFVGITRAREDLQISRAHYREFRGQRKITVPSEFLMELPREEMEVVDLSPQYSQRIGPDHGDFVHDEPVWDVSDVRQGVSVSTGLEGVLAPRTSSMPSLTTAAALAGTSSDDGGGLSAEAFHQGMAVIHPEYGLGKIVALSGRFEQRRAKVSFALHPEVKTFVLKMAQLRPARLE